MSVPQDIEDLIAGAPLSAHLATTADDRPHVAPVWYGYRDGVLSVITGGKKLENVKRNPRVAVSIEEVGGADVEWMVTLRGTATIVEDAERIAAAREHVFGKYQDMDDEAKTDGGEQSEESQAMDDDREESTESDRALIEIEIGSAASQHY